MYQLIWFVIYSLVVFGFYLISDQLAKYEIKY